MHLDPTLNDPQSSRAIQVDRFILSGKDSQLLSQEELQQIIREGVEKIKATSLDRLKADLKPTVQGQLTDLTQLLDQERPDLVAAANQVEALETILEDAHNYEPLTQTRPEEGVLDLILKSQNFSSKRRRFHLRVKHVRTRTWPRAKAGSFKQERSDAG